MYYKRQNPHYKEMDVPTGTLMHRTPASCSDIPKQIETYNSHKGPEYLRHHTRSSQFDNNYSAYCDITNCGKLLWVYRDPHKSRSSSALTPEFTSYDIDIRTGQRNLPYTPQPSERQAYLANQNAIKTALPLIMGQNRRACRLSLLFLQNSLKKLKKNIHENFIDLITIIWNFN